MVFGNAVGIDVWDPLKSGSSKWNHDHGLDWWCELVVVFGLVVLDSIVVLDWRVWMFGGGLSHSVSTTDSVSNPQANPDHQLRVL